MGAAQYQTGNISITNSSLIVLGDGTEWKTQVNLPAIFKVDLDGEATYSVATIISATRLHLANNYGGSTGSGLGYQLCTSFSVSRGYYRPLQGDSDFAEILSQETIDKIDDDISNLMTGNVGMFSNPVLKTANYQILTTDNMILASGNVTITLASASAKHEIRIGNRSLDVSASIRVKKSGGDTIENNASLRLGNKYDTVCLIGDGINTHFQF